MVREYVKGEKMKKANVHYLEHEPFTFKTSVGRKWVVYGSPVSCPIIVLTSTAEHLNFKRRQSNMRQEHFNTSGPERLKVFTNICPKHLPILSFLVLFSHLR